MGGEVKQQVLVPDEVAEEIADLLGLEEAKGEGAENSAGDFIEGKFGQLDQAEGEIRDEAGEVGVNGVSRQVEEGVEARGEGPGLVVLGQDDGDDRRQSRGERIRAAKLLPDTDLVGEEAKGDPGVLAALMLEEEVNEGRGRRGRRTGFGQSHLVEQIALGTLKAVVDVGTWNDFEAGLGNEADHARRKILLEKRDGSRQVLETGLGQLVVRLMQTIFRHAAVISGDGCPSASIYRILSAFIYDKTDPALEALRCVPPHEICANP